MGSAFICLGMNSGQLMSWEKSVWLGIFRPGNGHFSGSTFRRIFMSITSTSLLSFKAWQEGRRLVSEPAQTIHKYKQTFKKVWKSEVNLGALEENSDRSQE